jgi:hypothetical protein
VALLLELGMLFEKLVEQHRIHLIVAHGVWFSFFVGQHERWIHLCDFFGNQTKLRRVFGVRLVVECDWPERQIASLAFSIAAMSFLNRSEDATVPSWPLSDTMNW